MIKSKNGMKTFIIIWLGQLASMIGSGLIGFALAVWVFDQTGQATPFALSALFGTLPRILISPVAGAITDRWNRKKIMLISDTLSGLATLLVAILLLTGEMQVWMIYVINFFSSIFASFQQPAYSASIVMLVPKEQLTRANSMIQMGQAIESILTPVLAGALFTVIGLQGIIMIDVITYLIAILTLLLVFIPQPKQQEEGGLKRLPVFKDIAFGWQYLTQRSGLFGLLIYYAAVNFLLNVSAVMLGPLVLSFGSAAGLGLAQSVMGAGMLAGSLLMSIWGGPKNHRIRIIFGAIALASVGFIIAGLQPMIVYIVVGLFILMFFIPLGSGPSSALFSAKVDPHVQGRVFATRSMISQSMMPLAFLLSGILADSVFNPLLMEGGALAGTFVGRIIGTGPGRGIGLMLVFSGLILLLVSAIAYANPRIRHIETEIPDAVVETSDANVPLGADEKVHASG